LPSQHFSSYSSSLEPPQPLSSYFYYKIKHKNSSNNNYSINNMEHTLTHSPVKSLPPISQVTHSLIFQTKSHNPIIDYQPPKVFYTPQNLQNSQNMCDFQQETHGQDYLQPDYYMKGPIAMPKQSSRFPVADMIPKLNFPFSPASPQDKPRNLYLEKTHEMPDYAADHDVDHYQENQPDLYPQDYNNENCDSQKTQEDEENTLESISEMEVDTGPEAATVILPDSSLDLKSSSKVAHKPKKSSVTKPRAAPTKRPSKKKDTKTKTNRTRPATKRWTESDDDKVAFLREYGNLKWHEVTEFINGRHTPQAVQMRYLRSLKRRNDVLTLEQRNKLTKVVEEDYNNRFKRISIAMGPSFTPLRIQKLFMQDVGLGHLLKPERIWTKMEIAAFIDAADGDFDNFKVPHFGDKMPPAALQHIEKCQMLKYEDLVKMYIGKN
jgi:hypothetical protein